MFITLLYSNCLSRWQFFIFYIAVEQLKLLYTHAFFNFLLSVVLKLLLSRLLRKGQFCCEDLISIKSMLCWFAQNT